MRLKHQISLIFLLASILCACQASEPQISCCNLTYGLLLPGNLDGNWESVDARLQILQPTDLRYDEVTAAKKVRQYLSGDPDERNKVGVIIHELRRYAELAPNLGQLDFKLDPEDAGMSLPAPDVIPVGQSRQVKCLNSSPVDSEKSVAVCTIEVRYRHILSTMHFYFDGSTSSDNVETLINQALEETDSRIEEIDRFLSKSDG